MKKSSVFILFGLLPIFLHAQETTPTTPQNASIPEARRVAIEELLRLKKVDVHYNALIERQRKRLMEKTERILGLSGASPQLQALGKKIENELTSMAVKECGWESVKGNVIQVYADLFTDDEIKGMSDFYRSATGQSCAAKDGDLSQKMVEVGQKKILEALPKLQKIVAGYAEQFKALQASAVKTSQSNFAK